MLLPILRRKSQMRVSPGWNFGVQFRQDAVNDEFSKISAQFETSEQAVLQLQEQVKLCCARQYMLDSQVTDLNGRLSSLESRFSSISTDISSNFSEAFARIDACQSSCLTRSEAAHGKLVLIRSALSQVEETVRQHAVVFNEVHGGGLLRAHGALAADVADVCQAVCSLQVVMQTSSCSATPRSQSRSAVYLPQPALQLQQLHHRLHRLRR